MEAAVGRVRAGPIRAAGPGLRTSVIRPTHALVDLRALQANYQAVTRYVARPGSGRAAPPGVIAVVKANAYGHGAAGVGLALERSGARMLACADIEEGVLLREAGVRMPILVFGALSISDVSGLFDYDLVPTISTPSAARALQAAAAARARTLHCHLKIDTGMNRLGFRHDGLARTIPALAASRHLVIDAAYTHFATADDDGCPLFEMQRARFEQACRELERLGIPLPARHAANSAALLRDERVWYDFVRPGLLLYGVAPITGRAPLPLRPVMSLRSRVVAVKGVRPGEIVGYGARFRAERPASIATVPAGYADGLDWRLGGRGHVLVQGQLAPIVGSVCMDMIMVDVTGMAVRPGDDVVIIGEQAGTEIGVRDIAGACGTISYEVLSRLGSRIERMYQ
jgi:alanine racemase